MTTAKIVKIIEALPEEKQQEVRDFVEFIARKDRRIRSRIRKQAPLSSTRLDAIFWASSPSIGDLAVQQGVQPITDTDNLRGKNIWPEDDDIDEFVETIQRNVKR